MPTSGAVTVLLVGLGALLFAVPTALLAVWLDHRARKRTPPAPPRDEDLAVIAADLACLTRRVRALAADAADQPRDEHVGATA